MVLDVSYFFLKTFLTSLFLKLHGVLLNLVAEMKQKISQMCIILLQDTTVLYSLINAFNQLEVEVVSRLLRSAGVVYEHQSGGICLPHLNDRHTGNTGDI